MLDAPVHARRRQALLSRVSGPVLLMGNGRKARNLPATLLPFRQDSSFLYFTGCERPGAAALIDEAGCTLFLPASDPAGVLWHGPEPSHEALGDLYGVDAVRPADALAEAVPAGARALAVPDEARNQLATALTQTPLRFGHQHGDPDLVQAVIALRRAKGPEEIAELRRAATHSDAAHVAVMRATRPGGHERVLAALFEGVLAARGCVPGYDTILTQSGEILHNHRHDQPLESGRLLLLDGGGEVDTGYGVDITRTWPVSGTFSGRQRAAYDAVLEAQEAAIAACRPGVRYREVHDAACRVLATWLRSEGLITVDADTSVETGAHAVFFPHGVGHLLGLDVHDLEGFGDLPSYPPGQARSPLFGTANLRLDLPLEPGWVVTVEPGFYVVPAILADRTLRERLAGRVDFDRAEGWVGFGGVRIEDDLLITPDGAEALTRAPRRPQEIEALVGSGAPAEEVLCSTS